jgi:hypothetical protein
VCAVLTVLHAQLGMLRNDFPEVPILALTATARQSVSIHSCLPLDHMRIDGDDDDGCYRPALCGIGGAGHVA